MNRLDIKRRMTKEEYEAGEPLDVRLGGVAVGPEDFKPDGLIAVLKWNILNGNPAFLGHALRVRAVNLPFFVASPAASPETVLTINVGDAQFIKVTREFYNAQCGRTGNPLQPIIDLPSPQQQNNEEECPF